MIWKRRDEVSGAVQNSAGNEDCFLYMRDFLTEVPAIKCGALPQDCNLTKYTHACVYTSHVLAGVTQTQTHTHTHTYIYIYIYIRMCFFTSFSSCAIIIIIIIIIVSPYFRSYVYTVRRTLSCAA